MQIDPVNCILSWKYFQPLSKVCFTTFMAHQDWMRFHHGLRRTANYLSHLETVSNLFYWGYLDIIDCFKFQWYVFSAHLICILPLGVFLHLAVEAPLMILLNTIFENGKH
jgi:hypothetical protein